MDGHIQNDPMKNHLTIPNLFYPNHLFLENGWAHPEWSKENHENTSTLLKVYPNCIQM